MNLFLKTKNPYRIRVYRYGAKGARTPDLYAASVALSQLSYGPVCNVMFIIDDFFLKNKLFPLELTEKIRLGMSLIFSTYIMIKSKITPRIIR